MRESKKLGLLGIVLAGAVTAFGCGGEQASNQATESYGVPEGGSGGAAALPTGAGTFTPPNPEFPSSAGHPGFHRPIIHQLPDRH